MLIPVAFIFAIPSAGEMWATSACFLFGLLSSVVLGLVDTTMSVRGGLTAASAVHDSVHDFLVMALRMRSLGEIAAVSLRSGDLLFTTLSFRILELY